MDDSKTTEEGPEGPERYIRGYVLRYGEVDRDGDVFLPGSVDLVSYLSAPSDRKPQGGKP